MYNHAYDADFDDVEIHNNEKSSSVGVSLKWTDVNVFTMTKTRKCPVLSRKHKKKPCLQILKNVNGEARPGEILAIMGTSGSGKTTLLNVLNRRNCSSFRVTGSVKANKKDLDKGFIKQSAYVQQEDLFYPTLTVKEHLLFQAALRMDQEISSKERKERVEKILINFGLKKCENTKIGGALMQMVFKGISGGEKKRLAIASEVLTNPSVLFLDEPTSGLDSFMAESVLDSLRNLARTGKTIICTIHQPSSQLFNKFDKLVLLAEGRVAFSGSLADSEAFFSQCGLPCPRFFNPADHYIYNLAIVPGEEERCNRTISKICDCFDRSPINKFKEFAQDGGKITEIQGTVGSKSMYKANWFNQLKTLLYRSYLSTSRTPLVSAIRILQSIVIALIVGIAYLQQDYDGKGIMNINGVCFLTITQVSFPYLFGVVTTFCPELPIFLREHWNGMYRTDTYFLAKNIAEIPGILVSVSIYCCISYWLIGLNPDAATFFSFLGVSILLANVTTSFGYLISCIASNPEMALAIGPPLFIPLMLFGGLFMNADSIPVYFIWLKYLSWFNYGYEIIMVNQWKGVKQTECSMPKFNLNISDIPDMASLKNELDTLKTAMTCPLSGDSILKTFSFTEDNLAFDYSMLFVLLVGYRILAFLFLLLKSKTRA